MLCESHFASRSSVEAQLKPKKVFKGLKPFNSVLKGEIWKFLISKSTYFKYPQTEFRDGESSQKISSNLRIPYTFFIEFT